jgi:hypothetical protein
MTALDAAQRGCRPADSFRRSQKVGARLACHAPECPQIRGGRGARRVERELSAIIDGDAGRFRTLDDYQLSNSIKTPRTHLVDSPLLRNQNTVPIILRKEFA